MSKCSTSSSEIWCKQQDRAAGSLGKIEHQYSRSDQKPPKRTGKYQNEGQGTQPHTRRSILLPGYITTAYRSNRSSLLAENRSCRPLFWHPTFGTAPKPPTFFRAPHISTSPPPREKVMFKATKWGNLGIDPCLWAACSNLGPPPSFAGAVLPGIQRDFCFRPQPGTWRKTMFSPISYPPSMKPDVKGCPGLDRFFLLKGPATSIC